jgi:hypothetical protein
MLKYGNEYSLRKRIKGLFGLLDTETLKLIIGTDEKPNSFIERIVDTRKVLTHPDKRDPSRIQVDELSQINHQLKCIAMILLLTTLGVPEDILLLKIKENRFYNFLLPK